MCSLNLFTFSNFIMSKHSLEFPTLSRRHREWPCFVPLSRHSDSFPFTSFLSKDSALTWKSNRFWFDFEVCFVQSSFYHTDFASERSWYSDIFCAWGISRCAVVAVWNHGCRRHVEFCWWRIGVLDTANKSELLGAVRKGERCRCIENWVLIKTKFWTVYKSDKNCFTSMHRFSKKNTMQQKVDWFLWFS